MRYPKAVCRAGTRTKVYPEENAVAGVVCHTGVCRTREGSLAEAWEALDWPTAAVMDVHRCPQRRRVPALRAWRRARWANGNRRADAVLVSVYHESGTGQYLAYPQLQEWIALVKWIAG